MLEDVRLKSLASHPGHFAKFVMPGIALALLLCIAREDKENGKPGEGEQARPTFAPPGGGRKTLSRVVVERLAAKAEVACSLARKLTRVCLWAEASVGLIRALANWGLGGSSSSAAGLLSQVAEKASNNDLVLVNALAHLYRAVLLDKDGGKAEVVSAELRLAAPDGRAPNYASRTARAFLGIKIDAAENRPRVLFKGTFDEAEGLAAARAGRLEQRRNTLRVVSEPAPSV